MARKNFQYLLKIYLAAVRQRKTAGFTLLELLMAIVVGSIVIYAMLALVVNLLGTEQRETAKSQVQQEMAQAMDYIAAEVQQAIYVYEGQCLVNGGTTSDGKSCPGLRNIGINFGNNVPVLAFWKIEPIKASELPDTCDTPQCKNLMTSLNTYNLVIYGLKTDNPNNTWEGPARITRFELPQYMKQPSTEKIDPTQPKYNQDPRTANFVGWQPTNLAINYDDPQYSGVLVDLIDYNPEAQAPNCTEWGADYTLSPQSPPNNNTSFYACVKSPNSNGLMQDAIVYLRGNAVKKAGQPIGNRNSVYLPSIQRRVQARSVYGKDPSK